MRYDPGSGEFKHLLGPTASQAGQSGLPLVLILNWVNDSMIADSGFAEAAADAQFASLIAFDRSLSSAGPSPLEAPLHFIGHGRARLSIRRSYSVWVCTAYRREKFK